MKLANISLNQNVKYNDTLNPKVWDNSQQLKPEVRKKLIEIAEAFVEFLEIPASTVEDYLVVGSSANYNWNKYSDIDLHILIDFQKAGDTCNMEITEEWLMAKKALWMERLDIEVDGMPVEVGPQDINVKLNSSAVYSVLENQWIKKPVRKEPKLDEKAYDKKLAEMIAKIDKVMTKKASSKEISDLRQELKDMRQASLNLKAGGTEFSTNNLVYKTLRNQGLIDKLKNLQHEKQSKELSL
jgi:hypothetical protein